MSLETGHYFSAQGSGCEVWNWLARGASPEEAALLLGRRYDLDAGQASAAVEQFVASLLQHGLVSPETRGAGAPEHAALATPGRPIAYSPPVLQVYTDMEEVLLLDPIHEVSHSGWPMPREAGAPSA